MKIMLTGHRGFVGSALLTRLKKNHQVIGIDLKDGWDRDQLNNSQDLTSCDFKEEFDLIVHLAGKSGVRESLEDPAGYWYNNVEASRRLFERYGENTRILYASSSSAYEPDLNPYAASKYIMEELAERFNSGNMLGMRFHTIYSDNCPRENMFFNKLRNGTLEYVNGIIDIGTGDPIKVQNLAPNLPVRLNTTGEREWTCANTEKLKSLGWKPKYSVEKFLTNNNLGNIINLFNGETVE